MDESDDCASAGKFMAFGVEPPERSGPPWVPNLIVFTVLFGTPRIAYRHGTDIEAWGDDVGYETTANELAAGLGDGTYVWTGDVVYYECAGTPDSPPETDAELRGYSRPITEEEWEALCVEDPIWHDAELRAEGKWLAADLRREHEERKAALRRLLAATSALQLGRDVVLCAYLNPQDEARLRGAYKANDLVEDALRLNAKDVEILGLR